MSVASLDVGSPAWRAARAAVVVGALLRGDLSPDDGLDALAGLGDPPGGWWDVLSRARSAQSIGILLPRPGDPRGLALPRGVSADAVVGWSEPGGSSWLIPGEGDDWMALEAPFQEMPLRDLAEADRHLRACVVQAAHALDSDPAAADPLGPATAATVSRRMHEALVDMWVLGPPALPAGPRQLAALGLRMLLAVDDARARVETRDLESAARSAVEAAYGTTLKPR